MRSICLACLIYTIKDKPVEKNCYLNIFYMWLSKVIENGELTKNDMIHIHIDSRTLEYLENNESILPILYEKLPCPFVFISINPPKNSLEGMMNKYTIHNYTQDIYIYCDIDILIINPFRIMTEQMEPNTLYICSEGRLKDPNFGEGIPSDKPIPDSLIGSSAGKFAIYGKSLRDEFFGKINEFCDYSSKYYTVEQPIFNRAIYDLIHNYKTINTELLTSYVRFNVMYYDTIDHIIIFHDLAGEPGNGISHIKRIMDNLCLYNCGHYNKTDIPSNI